MKCGKKHFVRKRLAFLDKAFSEKALLGAIQAALELSGF
jgi:hypothetical protein